MPVKDFDILAGSLRDDTVTFASRTFEALVTRELGIHGRPLTRADLATVKKIRVAQKSLFYNRDIDSKFENDLIMVPHVTLEVDYQSGGFLKTVMDRSQSVSSFIIRHIDYYTDDPPPYILTHNLKDLYFLKGVTHVKSLTIVRLDLKSTDSFAELPPNLKHLGLKSITGELNDAKMRLFSEIPSLRSVSLEMELAQIKATTTEFPKNIRSVKFSNTGIASCGDLSPFAMFRRATYVTLEGCQIEALNPSQPFAWEALYLAKPSTASGVQQPKPMKLGWTLRNLRLFQSDDPTAIALDTESRAAVDKHNKTHGQLRQAELIDFVSQAKAGD
jgi:hypothetical protein